MNQTLQQMLAMLTAQHAVLAQKMGTVTDPATGKAIYDQSTQLLNRINTTQSLLFKQASQQLDAMLPAIAQANATLTTAINNINDLAGFLGSITKFLQAVDQAIDIAKTLMAA